MPGRLVVAQLRNAGLAARQAELLRALGPHGIAVGVAVSPCLAEGDEIVDMRPVHPARPPADLSDIEQRGDPRDKAVLISRFSRARPLLSPHWSPSSDVLTLVISPLLPPMPYGASHAVCCPS